MLITIEFIKYSITSKIYIITVNYYIIYNDYQIIKYFNNK